MHLVGQLSNPSAPLAAVLEAVAVVRPGPRELRESVVVEPVSGRLGNGVVQRAVVKVLEVARRPMCGQEVRLAVEDLLGHPVSEHSISWCLAAGARRRKPLFERVARGRYTLA
jgi:hypothetical protein